MVDRLPDRANAARAPFDPYGAVTHEVINQPVELSRLPISTSPTPP